MLIPIEAVHRAAAAITTEGDIGQDQFEDYYHCRFGMSTDSEHYWIHFDSDRWATVFIMRWV